MYTSKSFYKPGAGRPNGGIGSPRNAAGQAVKLGKVKTMEWFMGDHYLFVSTHKGEDGHPLQVCTHPLSVFALI